MENIEYLEQQLSERGWEHLKAELAEKINSGVTEFSLYTNTDGQPNRLDFELQFKKHAEKPVYYFNRINAALVSGDEVLSQASFRESWKMAPEEMGRVLEYGSKVAIYKEGLLNEERKPFNAWISVHTEEPLKEDGTLNLNLYHDNYYQKHPFNLEVEVSKLPASILEQYKGKESILTTSLKHGILVAVEHDNGNGPEPCFLTVNAKVGRIDVLDSEMEPISLTKRPEITQQTEQTPAGEKKNSFSKGQQVRSNPGNQNRNRPHM
ncbi:hypothetical protein [Edaphocola aurantiacus]|uniref:hypothetical protein n=1 Tax=Edaphocola aurantiacus TaxID=2601682 RepID=UPI001C95EF8A|nr:hypothetical protein [Edaphocola aurantiacus]